MEPTAQPGPRPDVGTVIRDLENRRFQAILDQHYEAVAGLCDPRLTYTHSNGVRDSLESYVAECRAGTYVYHRIDHPIDEVLVHGDTAVVHGRMLADLTVNGTRKALDNQSIAVWINDGTEWRLLAFQGTPIATHA